jgi:hypothetical protein
MKSNSQFSKTISRKTKDAVLVDFYNWMITNEDELINKFNEITNNVDKMNLGINATSNEMSFFKFCWGYYEL